LGPLFSYHFETIQCFSQQVDLSILCDRARKRRADETDRPVLLDTAVNSNSPKAWSGVSISTLIFSNWKPGQRARTDWKRPAIASRPLYCEGIPNVARYKHFRRLLRISDRGGGVFKHEFLRVLHGHSPFLSNCEETTDYLKANVLARTYRAILQKTLSRPIRRDATVTSAVLFSSADILQFKATG
jgi:hypothetical protein